MFRTPINKIAFLSAVSLLVLMAGCKKKLLNKYPDFEGYWQTEGQNHTLTIDHSGNAVYTCRNCEKPFNKVTGLAKYKDNQVKICNGFLIKGLASFDLDINAYPGHDQSGNYVTTLEGDIYYGCQAPAYLSVSNIGSFSADLNWGLTIGGLDCGDYSFTIQYKKTADAGWNTITTGLQWTTTISNLLPSTSYDWRIMSTSGKHSSLYVSGNSFTTSP